MNKVNTVTEHKRGFLIDMDGVIYRGSTMIPGADVFINTLKEKNIPFLFLTNNSRSTRRDLANRLNELGIKVSEQHIFTSAMATAQFLAKQKPNGTAYLIGEGGLILALHENGYSIVDRNPDYVVVGEGRTLTLEIVEKAIDFIIDGSKLIATNMDPAPQSKGWMKPGVGAITAMLEEATHKKAFCVGKPSPIMLRAARKRLGLQTAETVMIGDTMSTDILGGVQMGCTTVLVLSGITSRADMANYAYRPDIVVDSIADPEIMAMVE
ncbi:MAG: HAD-IIA family hydrolase [Bdellovibrionota bacterium]|jgi:NagD protein